MAKATIKKGAKAGTILRQIVEIIIAIVIGIFGGYGINLLVTPTGDGGVIIEAATIELSEEQKETLIETEEGGILVDDIPTVEMVEGNQTLDDTEGQGAYYNTEKPLSFYESVGLKKCLNNSYGAQCFELINQFFWNYAGRGLNSCGTGAAKGVFNCDNAKDDFEIIWDATQIKTGDIPVFSGGQYGHIGQAIGDYNNGYVALFGQNQGGAYCEKGGSATNVINKSTKDFIGAFRPKSYIVHEPTPEPTPEPTDPGVIIYEVEKGDTMAKIMKKFEGKVEWGAKMDKYASKWTSTKLNKGKSVFYGWTHGTGYGLFAGDVIVYNN